MTPQEFNEWERDFFESIPVLHFIRASDCDPRDTMTRDLPLPRWPRLKAQDKNWLKSCGIKG